MNLRYVMVAAGLFLLFSGSVRAKGPPPKNNKEIGGPVRLISVVVSPDGKTLVACGDLKIDNDPRAGILVLWDIATAKQRKCVEISLPDQGPVRFTPDGKYLLVADMGDLKELGLYHLASGNITEPSDPNGNREGFSPDGMIEVFNVNKTLRLRTLEQPFDNSNITKRTPLKGVHYRGSLCFSPDGKTFAVASSANYGNFDTIMIWDVASGTLNARIPVTVECKFQFRPDGAALAVSSARNVRLFDVQDGKKMAALETVAGEVIQAHFHGNQLVFSPNSKTVAAQVEYDSGPPLRHKGVAYRVWDASTGKRLLELDESERVYRSLAFSPDGQTLAGIFSEAPRGALDRSPILWDTVRRWDVSSGKMDSFPIPESMRSSTSRILSPDGKTLATAYGDGTAKLWVIGPDASRITTFGPVTRPAGAKGTR